MFGGRRRMTSTERRFQRQFHALERLIPALRERLAPFSREDLSQRFEQVGLPFASITDPQHLFADPHLQQGDLRFEPALALASGGDGLEAIRAIVRAAPDFLQTGGWLLLEHGYDQAAAVRALFAEARFSAIASARDLAGIERVTLGQFVHRSEIAS